MTADAEESRLARVRPALRDRYDGVVAHGDGALLWQHAAADVQRGSCDDRPLYWARLKLRRALRARGRRFDLAECAARGYARPFAANEPGALVTGFDPFHLDRNIEQSNPSGLAALALDGTVIEGVRIRTAILPVRFAAFDNGAVEDLLTPYFEAGLRLCLTVSMGREAFDLERFPGRRRSAASPDNGNVLTGASPSAPMVPPRLDGAEFLEFSLPAAVMSAVPGRWLIRDNRQVTTASRGTVEAHSLDELRGETAVAGSGGGYLSNEIAYRALRLRERLGAAFPVGHLHTPRVAGHDEVVEAAMVEQIRDLLRAALAVA